MYDIVIVGAGTAGLSAAIYAIRAGKNVLVLEDKTYGGQITNTPEIENYPGIAKISGYEFATNLYKQAVNLGASYKAEKVIKVEEYPDNFKKVITFGNEYICKAVILATGAKNRPLGIQKEKELIGAGVSYCATCDGMFFRGKDVAVVGGGNTALEDAGFLSNYCNKVYVIHRRDAFRGEDKLLLKLKEKSNVELILDSRVVGLNADDSLSGIIIENTKDKAIKELAVKALFIAIGQMPDNEKFGDIVKLDDSGYIVAGEDCRTSCPGIYVAGDCRTKQVRQLVTAASDGAVAAINACEYIG